VSSSTDAARPLLVFDGDCGFCTTWARRWQHWSGLERVEPWQFLDLAPLGLTEEQCSTAVQWVADDGTVASAEDAVIAALRHEGGAWSVLGGALALPGIHALAGVLYRLIAKYRYRLPGSTPACRLPQP
jgi:predicted DCC family thiol-disulfide oxidoreductase YuxK